MSNLKTVLRANRKNPFALTTALTSFEPAELIRGVVDLFTAGELRIAGKRKRGAGRRLCASFYRYHERNGHVADWFLTAARALRDEKGRGRYSVANLTERIRWDIQEGIIKTDGFRISNNLRAIYARLVLMRDPTLCGFFELGHSAADEFLMVDGQSWAQFAHEHEAELKRSRVVKVVAKPMKRPPQSVRLARARRKVK